MTRTVLLDNETLFFCFGPPKSGTTLLQRMLNLHPDISCPSEHQFHIILDGLQRLFGEYDQTLRTIDRRTGGQGVLNMKRETVDQIFRSAVESILKDAARGGEHIVGGNDNTIRKNLQLYNEIFEGPRMVYIIRNPADMAISAWWHNLRLSDEEGDKRHEQYMMQFGGFDGWVRQYAQWFVRDVETYRAFSGGRDNIILIRYEDLVSEKRKTFRRVCKFLNARDDDITLSAVEEKSSLAYMSSHSANPGFFRRASTNMGAGAISDELGDDIRAIAGEALEYVGYEL